MIDPIVSPDWVEQRSNELELMDVRWYLDGRSGLDAFASGHLPGARFVDLDRDLSDQRQPAVYGRHPLPTPSDFAAAMARLGIADESIVVAYDDAGGASAGRLVFMLRVLGRDAAVLDGGLGAWRGALETGPPIPSEPAAFTTTPWPADRFATAEELADPSPGTVVLDARSPERFRGEHEPVDPRPGHIPGAHNLPWADHLGPDGRFADPAALSTRYEQLGLSGAHQVICYCGSGVSACVDLLGLERAGIGPTKLFVPSWSGWSADPERPAALGER